MIRIPVSSTVHVRYDQDAKDNTPALGADYVTMRRGIRGKQTRGIWSWAGTTTKDGYHCINYHVHNITVHGLTETRVSWKVQVRLIPEDAAIVVHEVRCMGRLK